MTLFMPTSPLVVLLLLALLAAAPLGCGGCEEEPSPQGLLKDQGDMAAPEGDMAAPEGDMGQAIWPAYLQVVADPQRAFYTPGTKVNLAAMVVGTDAQPWERGEVRWQVEPAGAATEDSEKAGRWELKTEGEVRFTACSLDRSFSGAEVCGSWRALVDAGAPTLTLSSPLPGAQLGAGEAPVVIAGEVKDTRGEPFVLVNGQRVMLDGQGRFSTTMTPRFGINHVEVIASDSVASNPTVQELDFQWAPVWQAPIAGAGEVGAQFPKGLMLDLGQAFFDDRLRPRTRTDGKTETSDLADIVLLLLQESDLTSLIPNPVSDTSAFKLTVSDVDLGKPEVSIDVTEEGLEIFIATEDLLLKTTGSIALAQETLDLQGSVRAGASVVAQVVVEKKGPADPFEVRIKTVEVAIEQTDPRFIDARTVALFKLAQSALRTQIERVLVGALKTSFVDTVPGLLGQTLNALEGALALQQFSVDLGSIGKGELDLEFRGKITAFDKRPLRSMLATLDTTLLARLGATKPESKGIGLAQEATTAPPLLEGGRVQLAIQLGLVNGLLHGLWDGELLKIDATALIPESLRSAISKATVNGMLPPVANPPRHGEPYDLMISLGQVELEVDAPLTQQVVRYGVSLSAGANFEVKENAVGLSISEEPELRVWVIEVDRGGRARLGAEQLRSLVLGTLWPEIRASLGQGIKVQLPEIPLTALGGYAPRLSMLKLQFEQVRQVAMGRGFATLDVTLKGELAP